jgi:hypothetical protein
MKHGLGLDVLACPCGKRMRYLATIFDRKEPERLLTAKGLPHRIEPIRTTTAAPRFRRLNDVHHPVREGRRAPAV